MVRVDGVWYFPNTYVLRRNRTGGVEIDWFLVGTRKNLETIFDRVKYFMERESGHIIKLSEHINKKDPPPRLPSDDYTMTKNDHSSSCSVGVNTPPPHVINLATPWPFK